MLIAKIFVNERQIDEIHIQNVGFDITMGLDKYLIRKPEGFDNETILHDRPTGYHPLLQMAIGKIYRKKREKLTRLVYETEQKQ